MFCEHWKGIQNRRPHEDLAMTAEEREDGFGRASNLRPHVTELVANFHAGYSCVVPQSHCYLW